MVANCGKVNLPTGAEIQSLEAKLVQEIQGEPGTKGGNQG